MFATLAGRALVPVGLAVTGFMVICCLTLYSVISDNMQRAEIIHASNLADTILKSTRYAMHKSDRETLATIIRNVGEQKGVDHVRIFNKKGIVTFSAKADEINRQVDKSAEGCIVCHKGAVPVNSIGTMEQARSYKNQSGMEVMAITAPIYNGADCSAAACHVHLPDQKILGTLDIGLSRAELDRSLAMLRIQMIIFTLMSLILTIGGVTALLMKNIFLPIKKLRDFVADGETAGGTPSAPPHLPHDLDIIASSYYNSRLTAAGREQKAAESVANENKETP